MRRDNPYTCTDHILRLIDQGFGHQYLLDVTILTWGHVIEGSEAFEYIVIWFPLRRMAHGRDHLCCSVNMLYCANDAGCTDWSNRPQTNIARMAG